jgi:hypothetical protein
MLRGLLRRYPVPVVYLAGLGIVSVVHAHALSVDHQRFLVGWASTNLANLSTRPITTLIVSAFLSEDSVLVWVVITSTALVLLVHLFGNVRAAVLVATGHVVATLVSQGIAAWRLWLGAAPEAITHIADVGPSYVTMAALAAVMAYGPGRWPRILATASWAVLAPFLFDGIEDLDIAAVGHLVSMLVGAMVPAVFRWRPRDAISLSVRL